MDDIVNNKARIQGRLVNAVEEIDRHFRRDGESFWKGQSSGGMFNVGNASSTNSFSIGTTNRMKRIKMKEVEEKGEKEEEEICFGDTFNFDSTEDFSFENGNFSEEFTLNNSFNFDDEEEEGEKLQSKESTGDIFHF